MASSRLLHLVFSPSPAAASVAAASLRSFHVAAVSATSPESQRLLQFKLESIISIVGGEMVVADMRFTRDGFDYWKNAAIPSSSLVKELASTWANGESLSTTNMRFKFDADMTAGKKIEDFLQRMVADVEQRISKEGLNPLEGRRLVVQLADKQGLMAKDEDPYSKQALDRRLCVQSADEQEFMAQKLEISESKQKSSKIVDEQVAEEQEILAKEGKSETEEGFDRRLDSQDSMEEEKESEFKQESYKRLDVQLADGQDLMAKVENSNASLGRPDEQEAVGKEEEFEAMQVQSEKEQDIKLIQGRGVEAQKEEGLNQHATIGREDNQSAVAVCQETMEREKKIEASYRLKNKEAAKMQTAKASKQLEKKEEIMAMSMGLATCHQNKSVEPQIEEAKIQHAKEKEIKREDSRLAANEQKAMEKEKKSEATHRFKEHKGEEVQKAEEREQNCGEVMDHYQQQTDNIVSLTRRMGKKIVHIYYDKSSPGRVYR